MWARPGLLLTFTVFFPRFALASQGARPTGRRTERRSWTWLGASPRRRSAIFRRRLRGLPGYSRLKTNGITIRPEPSNAQLETCFSTQRTTSGSSPEPLTEVGRPLASLETDELTLTCFFGDDLSPSTA